MGKPFTNLSKERAIDFRARLDGLEEHAGYALFKEYFEKRTADLRGITAAINSNDFTAINNHNKRIYKAEAFEEVLQWVLDAKEQCEATIEGGRK